MQASDIIVSAMENHGLRVKKKVIEKPTEMFKKLDDRYDTQDQQDV